MKKTETNIKPPITSGTSTLQGMDFYELLAMEADSDLEKAKLVNAILENVKDGDSASIKILEKALLDGRYKKEEKLRISDEQFADCIRLAAERLGFNR